MDFKSWIVKVQNFMSCQNASCVELLVFLIISVGLLGIICLPYFVF